MTRYRFTGLTDEFRLIETMVDKSKMDPGEAAFLVRHHIEKCVEIWEDKMLCGYFIIAERDGVRQLHGYNLTNGRARHAFKICMRLLDEERGKIYSGHGEASAKVNGFLKLLGFKEIGRTKDAVYLERQESAVSV